MSSEASIDENLTVVSTPTDMGEATVKGAQALDTGVDTTKIKESHGVRQTILQWFHI